MRSRILLLGPALGVLALAFVQMPTGSAQMPGMDMGGAGVDSGDIPPGGSWNHTFTQIGTFTYHCHPHPSMTGYVTVLGSGATRPDANVTIESYGFRPMQLVVRPGTTVRWDNLDNVTHTVTEGATETHESHGSPSPGFVMVLAVVAGVAMKARR